MAVITSSNVIQDNKESKPTGVGTIQHGSSCPEACKTCDQVAEKALKFILSQQKEDGTWNPWEKPKKSQDFSTITVTCLNGLALFASGSTTKDGPYKTELKKLEQGIEKLVAQCIKDQPVAKGKGMLAWFSGSPDGLYFAGFLLAHYYHHEKSDKIKNLLEQVRDCIIKKQGGDGGWSYAVPNEASQNFSTNHAVLSLLSMKQVGIEIDSGVLDKACTLYSKGKFKDKQGAFLYGTNYPGTGQAGRTLAALWPMYLLGISGTDIFKKAKDYVKKNFSDLDLCSHGPSYHYFFGGLASYYAEEKGMWKDYNSTFRDAIVKAQNDKGAIRIEARQGAKDPLDGSEKWGMGFCYTTPIYAIILQLHKGHLLFDKIKPMK